MRPAETISQLASFEGRGAGTDAERRAASWLAHELMTTTNRDVRVEPLWCRPNAALAQAWHALLALAGSLIAIPAPALGTALIVAALVSIIADALTGTSLGRRLTRERASQNVVARTAASSPHGRRLILTANYDAGRLGVVHGETVRRASAAIRDATRGATPGWLGWLSIATAWLLTTAVLRAAGHHGTALGAIQLPPTVALLVAFAALLDAATGPAADDNASGTAAAIALARALDAAPPLTVDVELLLTGASAGDGTGLRRYLSAQGRDRRNTIVIGIAACGRGTPRFWVSDGPLIPLRYAPQLRALSEELAGTPHRGRGTTPATAARLKGFPAIAIGCLDDAGTAPRSQQRSDGSNAVDPAAIDALVEFALTLIDAIDAALPPAQAPLPTPA